MFEYEVNVYAILPPMNRPALSLAQGLLYTALALLGLFVVGAILMNGDMEGTEGIEGTEVEGGMDGDSMSKAPARPTGASSAAATAPAPAETCGQKNAECATQDDCCGNMGLECKEVRTSTGDRSKRCLPVEVMVCKSDCGEDGLWGAPRACKTAVAPKDMPRCQDFVGTDCKASVHEARNSRECTDT